MGAHVTMSPATRSVGAGETATFDLQVRNTGTVVDEFTFEVLGDVPDWVQVEPAVLPLFPGTEETVRVRVTPPRASTTQSGQVAFAIRAVSREDPGGSAVAEATLDVAPFSDLFIELVPRTVRGRRRGKTDLAVDNRGNVPVHLDLVGLDPDEQLAILVDPGAMTSEPGTATFADVVVRPKARFWRGPSKTLPFQVIATPVEEGGGEPLTTNGTMVQEAAVPPWLARTALLGLLLLLLLIPLWFAFLKPRVESTARDAAQEEVEEALVEAGIDPDGGGAAGGGEQAGGGEAEEDEGTPVTVTTTSEVEPEDEGPGEPTDLRLAVTAPPGGTSVAPFTVPAGELLRITDIVLQNPQGDTGRIEVRRDGAVLLALALQNFRDIDYHFVAPLIFQSGQTLELRIVCDAVLAPATQCSPSGSFVGFVADA